MKTYCFDGHVTALSSITHGGGQSYGINQMLRREKIVQPDMSIEEVPIVSGNSLRGILRDLGMLHMCRSIGFGEPNEKGIPLGLSLAAFYFLFSGGSLTSDGGKALKVDEAREVRRLIPLVGIFGGALGNHIMPGKLKMGKLIPIVRETVHLLPDSIKASSPTIPSIWECCQREMYVRTDDEKNEHLRTLLSSESKILIEGIKAEKEMKADSAQPQGETGQSQQMLYYVESLAAGTQFYLRMSLDDVTDVEFDAFATALVEFSRKPFIGGKSGTGLGEVSLRFDRWLEIDSRMSPQGRDIAWPAGIAYQKHLESSAPDIVRWLASIN